MNKHERNIEKELNNCDYDLIDLQEYDYNGINKLERKIKKTKRDLKLSKYKINDLEEH